MITLSWNCRGLAQSSTVRSLRAIIRKHNPDVIFLTETKTASHLASPILNQLGFVNMLQAPPCGSKGGLLLAWKNDINFVSVCVSSNIISVWYYSVDPTVKCLFSFVYGPPYKKTDLEFWMALADFGNTYSVPWICMGDFNTISSSDDKLGGRPFDHFSFNPINEFMDSFGMVDLGFSGNPFTWSNHRQGFDLIKERLDRSIANNQWIHFFPNYSITHLPAHNSDHNPLLLDTSIPLPSLPRPFRFEEFWTRDPTCGIVVEEAWSSLITGSPSYCLAKKLKLTKSAIKQWNKLYFGDIKTKVDNNLALLDTAQQAPPTDSNLALELHLQNLLYIYLQQEESLWKQKSRELWLTTTDLNTRFFHTSTLIRRRRNSINLLQSPQGGWLSDRSAIGDCFITNFKLLFTSSHPSPNELLSLFDPVISDEDNLHLGSLPTESEIFASLKSLGRTKAPGPDGFTALFYVKYWDYIKNTVLLAIGNFFQNNHLLREQNHTLIALIPKRLGASSVHHYRPISLCNIIYKIISKLLANRLKPLLSKVISPF